MLSDASPTTIGTSAIPWKTFSPDTSLTSKCCEPAVFGTSSSEIRCRARGPSRARGGSSAVARSPPPEAARLAAEARTHNRGKRYGSRARATRWGSDRRLRTRCASLVVLASAQRIGIRCILGRRGCRAAIGSLHARAPALLGKRRRRRVSSWSAHEPFRTNELERCGCSGADNIALVWVPLRFVLWSLQAFSVCRNTATCISR